MLAAIAGLLLLARLSVGSPTIGTQGEYDLMSIAAVVLGGTLLSGGKGNIAGTLGGVAIFAVMDNVMGVMQVNPFLKDVVRGVVIVARGRGLRPARDRPPTGPLRATDRPRRRPPGGTMTSPATPQVHLDVPATRPLPAHQSGVAGRFLATLATPGGAVFVLVDRPARRHHRGQPELRRPRRRHPLRRPHRADRDRRDRPVLRDRLRRVRPLDGRGRRDAGRDGRQPDRPGRGPDPPGDGADAAGRRRSSGSSTGWSPRSCGCRASSSRSA